MPSSIRTFDLDIGYISELDDQPNDVEGLSASELKALFDKAPLDLKSYINTKLIPDVAGAIDAAAIGISSGESIGTSKLSDGCITTEKLNRTSGSQAVTTSTIRDGAVTNAKLSEGCVSSSNMQNNSVLESAIRNAAVTAIKLASNSVTAQKIADGNVTTSKINDSAVTVDKLAGGIPMSKMDSTTVQSKRIQFSAVALNNASTGRVTNSNITANSAIIVSPAVDSISNWSNFDVKATEQGDGWIDFTAISATTVTANILILN